MVADWKNLVEARGKPADRRNVFCPKSMRGTSRLSSRHVYSGTRFSARRSICEFSPLAATSNYFHTYPLTSTIIPSSPQVFHYKCPILWPWQVLPVLCNCGGRTEIALARRKTKRKPQTQRSLREIVTGWIPQDNAQLNDMTNSLTALLLALHQWWK